MDPKKIYINRDKSWLQFNARVLQEAADDSVPLIERFRFLGIHSNNLDEFFRVRYASIKRMGQMGGKKVRKVLGGYAPTELLGELSEEVIRQQRLSQDIYEKLIELLKAEDIHIINEKSLTQNQREFVRKYYIEKVSPTIFILLLDQERPFPELKDKSIYLAIKLYKT
jgi:polyphosphate kinase